MRSTSACLLALAVGVPALALPAVSSAAVLTYDLSVEFSGGTPPAGAAPWVRVSLDDGGTPGDVLLTVQSLSLTGGEFLTDLYLNLDPLLNAASLTFGTEAQSLGSFALPSKSKGTNAINGNAAGTFDLGIEFDNAPPADRFGAGDAYTLLLAGIPTLTASSFDFLSVGGGQGPLKVAAHIQGIGPNAEDSGKITIPVPEPLGTATCALLVAAVVTRRR